MSALPVILPVTLPVRLAVIVPAAKLPLASRSTNLFGALVESPPAMSPHTTSVPLTVKYLPLLPTILGKPIAAALAQPTIDPLVDRNLPLLPD